MVRKLLSNVVLVSAGLVCARAAQAQQAAALAPETPAAKPAARFAAPVLLLAGEKSMGARRLYPSPVFQDMNGDGRADIVIGYLPGRITVALRLAGDGPPRFGPEEPLLARDGKPLDFGNW